MPSPVISVKNYSFKYPQLSENTLDDISFTMDSGELLLLCGATGCGKTTLLRSLKKEIAPVGEKSGTISFFGNMDNENCFDVGFVSQSPESQTVMDSVWHELAFGLENMGLEPSEIRRRIAEAAGFFGLEDQLCKKVSELSGGMRQLINLAAVTAMRPKILLLDEPTAQLDPIAAKEFLQMLFRINRELSVAVVVSEHRFGEILENASKIIYLKNGAAKIYKSSDRFVFDVFMNRDGFQAAMPQAAKMAFGFGETDRFPLSVRDGKNYLADKKINIRARERESRQAKKPAIEIKDLWYKYPNAGDFALKGASLKIESGGITAVLGANSSGKSTLLKAASGIIKPYSGRVKKARGLKVCLLPQSPEALFSFDSLHKELMEFSNEYDYTERDVLKLCERFSLSNALCRHPYDLSGGEKQKAAFIKLLLCSPDALLLDEPEKGLDAPSKQALSDELRLLSKQGKTIVTVTHDIEFAARTADSCVMVMGGETVSASDTRDFFSDNLFYTTDINKITSEHAKGIILTEDIAYEG